MCVYLHILSNIVVCSVSSLQRFFYQLSHSTNFSSFSFSSKYQVGLLYDEVSLQNVLDMIADWTMEEREMLRNKVITNMRLAN